MERNPHLVLFRRDARRNPKLSGKDARQKNESIRREWTTLWRGRVMAELARLLEERRREALIERVKADRIAERERREAEVAAEEDGYTLNEETLAPTPEQIDQASRNGAGFTTFTPRLRDGTVATQVAYRRRDVPQAHKMMLTGVIDFGGLQACIWYRNLYETTGLSGAIPSTDYQKEVFAQPNARVLFTDWQVEAQERWREVRASIDRKPLALLDRMIIEDVPIYRAARVVGKGWRASRRIFATAVEQVQVARENMGADS